MKRHSASIILIDKDGRILLQKRAPDKKRFPGQWGFFGGGIEEGETEHDTVIREAQEELCYTLKKPTFLCKQVHDIGSICIYKEDYDHQQELILEDGDSHGWFHFHEIYDLDLIHYDKVILLELREEGKI